MSCSNPQGRRTPGHYMWGNVFRPKDSAEDSVRESLRNVPLFQDLSGKELNKIEDRAYMRTYRAGEYIFQRGEPALGMYIVHQGSVRIEGTADSNGEDPKTIRELAKGDFFGETALIDEHPHPVSARATADTKIIGFYRPDFLILIHHHPRMGTKLLLALGRTIGARLRACIQDTECPST